VERLPGSGCYAEGQRGEVGVIGCGAVKARVRPAAVDTTTHLPLHYDQLMSERRVLCLKRLFDLNGEANRVRKKQSSAIIAVDVRRFGHVINKNEIFGTHKRLSLIFCRL
jgi:hypothetical protein